MPDSLPENRPENWPENQHHDDPSLSPERLLRRAAEGDAARAIELLAYVSPTKLLDAVLTQAELAVDEDRDRPAGIDAIAELERASIEVMDLPQGTDLSLDPGETGDAFELDLEFDLEQDPDHGAAPGLAWGPDLDLPGSVDASDIVWHADDDAFLESPVLIGWDLTTVSPGDLEATVLTLPIRPWHLALVAFVDSVGADGIRRRRVAAAAADGRLIGAQLRFTLPADDPEVLGATVSRDPADLGEVAHLAASLRAALRSAARGIG